MQDVALLLVNSLRTMQTSMQFGIVADDLTGAADVAAPFAVRGLSASVAPEYSAEVEAEVSVWNTDTRALQDEREITRRIERVAEHLKLSGPTYLYKKVDSALRGWLALELEVWRRAFPQRVAVICPAFPANGRTVEGDSLFVNGRLWQETEFAPPDEARGMVEVFGVAGKAVILSLEEVRAGKTPLCETLLSIPKGGAALCSAVTEADMDTLAEALAHEPMRYLPIGSAGLSRAMAQRIPLVKPLSSDLLTPFQEGCVLAIVGSRHAVSRNQAKHVAESLGVTPVVWNDGREAATVQEMRHLFGTGARCVLLTTPETASNLVLSAGLGRVAGQALHALPSVRTLFLTGGDTAYHVAKTLDITHMEVLGELEPGLVRGILHSRTGESWAVITKAGGFGSPDTLSRILIKEKAF